MPGPQTTSPTTSTTPFAATATGEHALGGGAPHTGRAVAGDATPPEALRRSELRHRTLVEAMTRVMWTADAGGLTVDMTRWRELTGQTAEEVHDDGWVSAIHPDDRERAHATWRAAVASRTAHDIEYRLRLADGSHRRFRARAVPVPGPHGEPCEWVGILDDIEEERRTQDLLVTARREAEMRAAEAESLAAQLRTQTGALEAQAVQLQTQASELERQADQLQRQAFELERQTERARTIAEELERVNARLAGALADADRARRDAEGANLAKSALLGTVSHELRTPLNAIAGYVELLEMGVRGPLTSEQREDLARVRRSTQVLTSLVNDVLSFARLEAGQIELRMQRVPLSAVLGDLEALIGPQARAKGLALSFAFPTDGGGRAIALRADPERLKQILLNLLSNAVKFTSSGGTIAVEGALADEDRIAIRVVDTGRGIPAERLDDVFAPFVQVDRHLAPASHGFGLGLAIARNLARAMGGEVEVASTEGHGSTFTLSLPRA